MTNFLFLFHDSSGLFSFTFLHSLSLRGAIVFIFVQQPVYNSLNTTTLNFSGFAELNREVGIDF